MALTRRAYLSLLVPVTGVALAVALGVLLLDRDESAPDDAREAAVGTALLFAEFGTNGDRVFSADATNPSIRTLVATIPHAPEWGINPSGRAAGDLVAFTVLPPSAVPARETPAELHVLNVATGAIRLLATDADLLTAPVFDHAGTHLVYRRNGEGGQQSIVSVDLATGAQRSLYTVETTYGIYPVGSGSDNGVLFAVLSRGGTDLYRVGTAGQPQLVLHASNGIARDWDISPDGRRVSFVAPGTEDERVVNRLEVVDLASGTRVSVPSVDVPRAVEEYAPVWRPDGSAITLGREAYPDDRAGAVTYPLGAGTPLALATPRQGYDVPVSWSADGEYLAARSFDGTSAQDPGDESLVVIALGGERQTVTATNEVVFLGWVGRNG